tara:strand:- start:371 stop:1540 length:1170 start_codon:yes stop_codon:yes gene_type:complete
VTNNQLPGNLTVPFINNELGYPVYLAPFLIPALLVRHNLETADIEKYLLDKMVKKEVGNTLRSFLDAGWTRAIDKNIHRPIIKSGGKYQLPAPEDAETEIVNYINPKWLKQVTERIKAIVERHIMFIGTLRDNTAIHNYPGSHWHIHWMNPAKNNQNLHFKNTSLYHYPEWADPSAPNPPGNKVKAKNTGLMIEAFYDTILGLILAEIKPKYRKFFGVEAGNEVPARIRWHKRMDAICRKHRIPVGYRRITSMGRPRKPQKDEWFFYRTQIYKIFNYCVHQIGSASDLIDVMKAWKKEDYERDDEGRVALDAEGKSEKKPIRAKFLPSCDGQQYPLIPEIKKITKESLQTKNYGLELLYGLWGGKPLPDLEFKYGKAMMNQFKMWAGLI